VDSFEEWQEIREELLWKYIKCVFLHQQTPRETCLLKERAMTTEEEIADLKRQLVEVKDAMRAAQPKPQPTAEEQERATAKWIDEMHQLREGRMAMATPPSALQDLVAAEPKGFMAGVLHDNRAPTGRPSMIPSSQESAGASARPSAGDGTGYSDPRPLGPQPGINWVDAQLIADEVRQRAELKRKLGEG
jgi:hypothetical protein